MLISSVAYSIGPSSNVGTPNILPPCSAKLTLLKRPPITNNKIKIFIIFLFIGLLVSDGFKDFCEILYPYKKPIMNAGANIKLIRIGDWDVISSKNGCIIKNSINAAIPPDANIIQFPYFESMDSRLFDEFQLYINYDGKIWLKTKCENSFGKTINSFS